MAEFQPKVDCRWTPNPGDPNQNRIDVVATPMVANLTDDNDAWDTGPVFSPDGRTMAYRAMARPGFEADKYGIFLRDMATGYPHLTSTVRPLG